MKTEEAVRYAKLYNVSPTWLMIGRDTDLKKTSLQSVLIWKLGDVGRLPDGEIELVHEKNATQMFPKMQFVPDNSSFIDVIGSQAKGIARLGWMLFCQSEFYTAEHAHRGQLCVCKDNTGKAFLRILRKFDDKDNIEFETPLGEIEYRPINTTISMVGVIIPPAGVFAGTKILKELSKLLLQKSEQMKDNDATVSIQAGPNPFQFEWDAFRQVSDSS